MKMQLVEVDMDSHEHGKGDDNKIQQFRCSMLERK